jgi:FkbM family methyltransferase
MKKNNVIFDVGANDGLDGLGFALFNKDYNVFSFEANPELVSKIEENKKKIEKFFKLKLDNYEIFNEAVSDFEGTSDFNISQHDLCSSLLPYKFVKTKKKIKTKVITLEKFCLKKCIDNIVYIHIDTQGSDLDVLKGLGSCRSIVHSGVIETMIKKEDRMYEGASYYEEVKFFFEKWGFNIYKDEFNNYLKKEINVYFNNKKISQSNILKFRRFKKTFINRIIKDKYKFKDFIYMIYFKLFIL